jgi:hypothetical protein
MQSSVIIIAIIRKKFQVKKDNSKDFKDFKFQGLRIWYLGIWNLEFGISKIPKAPQKYKERHQKRENVSFILDFSFPYPILQPF